MRFKIISFCIFFITLISSLLNKSFAENLLVIQDKALPIVSIAVVFETGSVNDPKGKEGLAALTAQVLREGGIKESVRGKALSRLEFEKMLEPIGAQIITSVSKNQTTFRATVSSDSSIVLFKLLARLLLDPALEKEEFLRLKQDTETYLKVQLPQEDQETLGKYALDAAIYGSKSPYYHPVTGLLHSVQSIQIEDVQSFIQSNLISKNLRIGFAGKVSNELKQAANHLVNDLKKSRHPNSFKVKVHQKNQKKSAEELALKPRLNIIEGDFPATGIHIGLNLDFTRGAADFYPAYFVALAFGKHRSFVGRLMNKVRELRGLNYGTYSYVEDFPNGGEFLDPQNYVGRKSQNFSIWARPTPFENGCFLFKMLLRELELLNKNGLSEKEFDLVKSHLIGIAPTMGAGLEQKLGYAMDSLFYSIPVSYLSDLQKFANKVTRNEVNHSIKKWLNLNDLHAVVVTKNAQRFLDDLSRQECSVSYPSNAVKDEDLIKEDTEIKKYKVPVQFQHVRVTNSAEVFK